MISVRPNSEEERIVNRRLDRYTLESNRLRPFWILMEEHTPFSLDDDEPHILFNNPRCFTPVYADIKVAQSNTLIILNKLKNK